MTSKEVPNESCRNSTANASDPTQAGLCAGALSKLGRPSRPATLDAGRLSKPLDGRRSFAADGPHGATAHCCRPLPGPQNPRTVQLDLAQENQPAAGSKSLPVGLSGKPRQCHLHGRSGFGQDPLGRCVRLRCLPTTAPGALCDGSRGGQHTPCSPSHSQTPQTPQTVSPTTAFDHG